MNLRNAAVLVGGVLFGFGLALSGMTRQEIVLSFLQLKDLGLLFVLGAAALLDMIAVNIFPRLLRQPFLGGEFRKRTHVLEKRVIIGAMIFGMGWGISGQCPGSALASLGTGNLSIIVGLASMFIGAYAHAITIGKAE